MRRSIETSLLCSACGQPQEACRCHPPQPTLAPSTVEGEAPGPALPPASRDFLDRFESLEKIGAGGMGAVYAGSEKSTGRRVAIKFLLDPTQQDAVRRFEREGRMTGALDHPNIIKVFEAGTDGNLPYLMMEFVSGRNLDQILEKKPMALSKALDTFEQILAGLEHAHSRGIIHRDIKPANVLVDPAGTARIVDFGIAKSYGMETTSLTKDGAPGTLDYAAPEQFLGKVVTQSDVFSAAQVLVKMVTGNPVMLGGAALGFYLCPRGAGKPPQLPSLDVACPNLPAVLRPVVTRALTANPAARYPTAADFRSDILRVRKTLARPASSVRPAAIAPAPPKQPGLALPVGILLFLLLLGAGTWQWRAGRPAIVAESSAAVSDVASNLLAPRMKDPIDKAEMVLVPGGDISVGRDGVEDAPVHIVHVEPFYIDRYEVSNHRYEAFMKAAHAEAPGSFAAPTHSAKDLPVSGVTWAQAAAYAAWATKRLPTEAEWELAACGPKGRSYPWGEELPAGGGLFRANFTDGEAGPSADGYANTAPIGAVTGGATAEGCFDLAGNVREWCSDWYDPAYYPRSPKLNPAGPEKGTQRVVRGGSYRSDELALRGFARDRLEPRQSALDVGFRCVRSASAARP